MSPLRWTCKSTRTLAEELSGQGLSVSANTVGRLLQEARPISFSARRNSWRLQAGASCRTSPQIVGPYPLSTSWRRMRLARRPAAASPRRLANRIAASMSLPVDPAVTSV